jgi:hypothetical protein
MIDTMSKVRDALAAANQESKRDGKWSTVKEVNQYTSEVGLFREVRKADLDALVEQGQAEKVRGYLYRVISVAAAGLGEVPVPIPRYIPPTGTYVPPVGKSTIRQML